jgi:hypothetical protein
VRSSTNGSPEKRSQFARSGIGFSSYSRQKSVRNLGVSEIIANSYEKNARIEKIISASTQNKETTDPHIQRDLMQSQGTLSTSTSKFLRPSKFNNSFKKSSKKELLTLEVNTPRSKVIKGEKTGKSGSFSKPINKGASSPKSIKAKLMSSTRMLPDSLCDAMSSSYIKNKGGSLTTNMIKMMHLSESQKINPTSLDYTTAGNISSFTDLNSPEPGHAGSSNNSGSPVLTKGQRQVKVKSRFNRPIIIQNMEQGWKNLGSGYSLDKGKPKKNTGGSRLDLDGSHADEKHRDYKLNNMFKMIEFLEKDQNLTSHRLKIRVS